VVDNLLQYKSWIFLNKFILCVILVSRGSRMVAMAQSKQHCKAVELGKKKVQQWLQLGV